MPSGRLFKIHKLSVNISFHDDYTPDTWSETAHAIFKMLKELATTGVAREIMNNVHCHASYLQKGSLKIFDAEWNIPEEYDDRRLKDWVTAGFLEAGTRNLSEAY